MSEPTAETATELARDEDAEVRGVPVRKIVVTVVTVIVPMVVYFVIPLDDELGKVLALVLVVGAAASLIPMSIRQAGLVLRSPDPLFDAVRCIVSAVMLLVVAFSAAYYVLGTGYDGEIQGIDTKLDSLYFTVTILATVGFGDITATGQVARGLVTVQMVVNLAVLAVALRVVSWALKERGSDALANRTARALRKRST
jgi:uncharacterized membrane protein YqjE